MAPGPRLSVIVVSDYAAGDSDRHDEFSMMHALKAQDIAEPFEIVLAESERSKSSFPPELLAVAPNTRVAFFPHTSSPALKDAALASANGSLVAVFETDAVPQPGWLRLMAEMLDRHPEAGAISGRTIYGYDSALKRAAGLIDRGYLEEKKAGPTPYVCNNGALYRRPLLEAYPYSPEANPFVAGRLRSEAMRRAGVKLLFRPDAVSVHAFGGLKFLREVRRNQGFSDARTAYLARGRKVSFLDRALLHLSLSWDRLYWDSRTSWRAASGFIYWYDWPLVAALIIGYRFLEWPAISIALAGKENLSSTPYH